MTAPVDVTALAGGLDFVTARFLNVVRQLAAVTARAEDAEAKIAAVEALLAHARKISPSASMAIYCTDLERALGNDAPRAHKHGQADDGQEH